MAIRVPNSPGFTAAQPQQIAAPAAAFGTGGQGLADAGKDLMAMGQQMAEHVQRVQTREDVVARAGAQSAFVEAAQREMTRLSTEADWADLKTFDSFGQFLTSSMEQSIAKAGGSADSQAMLRARLTDMRTSLVNQAAQQSAMAGQKRVTGLIDQSLSALTAKVLADPATLGDHAQAWDRTIDDFAPALTPDQEATYRLEGRRALVVATMNQLADRPGGAAELSRAVKANPQYMEMLSPDQQAGLYRKINAAAEAERQARAAAQAPLNKLEGLLNRRATISERYQAAGLGGTFNAKMAQIQEMEAAGIKLSRDQQLEYLGIKPAQGLTAQTDAGKAVADRQMFVSQFGEGSPQVKAFDDASAGGGGAKQSDIAGMRKEHTTLSADYVKVRSAYQNLVAFGKSPSPASDIGIIYGFMKMNDPGSTVMEGEKATAQNAAGVDERVRGLYNRMLTGESMTHEQRTDFITTAGAMYKVRLEQQQRIDQQFRGMATRAGYRPEDVVVDFIGQPAAPASHPPATGTPAPTGAPPPPATGTDAPAAPSVPIAFPSSAPAASAAQNPPPAAQPTTTIRLDLNGNVITE